MLAIYGAPARVHARRSLPSWAAYSVMLAAIGEERGCLLIGSLADLRRPDPTAAAPGMQMDALGTHLASYSVIVRALVPLIAEVDRRRSCD